MANMTLPTEAEVRAIDTSAFTWDDLLDGLLTTGHASVIKAVCDKMEAGETICISEPFAATGKTAKFVLDNVTGASNLKIVTSDTYVDTYLTLFIMKMAMQSALRCSMLIQTRQIQH